MEAELESLVLRLIGENESFVNSLQESVSSTQQAASQVEQAAGKIEGFSGTMESFAASAASALGALAIGSRLTAAFAEWGVAEDTALRLEAAIRSNGRAVEPLMAQYRAYASELQNVTRIGDDTTLAVIAQAESFGLSGAAAIRATQAATAFAAINGGAAESYLRLTAALERGDVQTARAMARMVPQLRGIADESEFLARAQQLVSAGMDAARAAAQSSTGQIAQLGNEYGDLMEELGRIAAEGVQPVVAALRDAVAWFQDLDESSKTTIVTVAALTAGFLALGPIVAGLAALIGLAFSPITIIIGGAIAATSLWVNSVGGVTEAWEQVSSTVSEFIDWFRPVWTVMGELISEVAAVATEIWTGFTDLLSASFASMFGEATVNWEGIRDVIVTSIEMAIFTLRNFGQVANYTWTAIKHGLMVAVDFIKDALIGFVAFVAGVGRAIVEPFIAAWEAIRTRSLAPLRDLQGRIGRAFDQTFSEVSAAMGAGESEVTARLGRELQEQGEAMAESFEEFQRSRREAAEEEAATEWWNSDDFVSAAESTGYATGAAMARGAQKGAEKFDAVLSGSAEALARIAAYQDALSEGRPARTPSAPAAATPGGPSVPLSETWSGGLAIDLFRQIRDAVVRSADREPIELQEDDI